MGGTSKPHIVVQCIKCNKVLSDSTALVLSDQHRRLLAVKAASSITVHEAGTAPHPISPQPHFLFSGAHVLAPFERRRRSGAWHTGGRRPATPRGSSLRPGCRHARLGVSPTDVSGCG